MIKVDEILIGIDTALIGAAVQLKEYDKRVPMNAGMISVMNKSDLIERLYLNSELSQGDAAAAVSTIINTMQDTLGNGGRVEIRGFGAFSLHERKARTGRNPKTGEAVEIPIPATKLTSSRGRRCGSG
jgi:integration host factor subunit beta